MSETDSPPSSDDKREGSSNSLREDIYLSHRANLDRLRVDQLVTLDRALVLLASGVIGLSVLLLSGLKEKGEVINVEWLFGSWITLMVALFSNLLSYMFSSAAASYDMAELDRQMIKEEYISSGINHFNTITKYSNALSIAFFFVGCVSLLIFGYTNI